MPLTIVPSIDLRAGKVVRLKQGDYGRQVNYDVDPLEVARSFADAGAEWMHVVDLDGAKEGRPVQTELISRIIRADRIEGGSGRRNPHHGGRAKTSRCRGQSRSGGNQGDGRLAVVSITGASSPLCAKTGAGRGRKRRNDRHARLDRKLVPNAPPMWQDKSAIGPLPPCFTRT